MFRKDETIRNSHVVSKFVSNKEIAWKSLLIKFCRHQPLKKAENNRFELIKACIHQQYCLLLIEYQRYKRKPKRMR